MYARTVYEALFSPPPHKSLGTKLLAVVLGEGTCQELEPNWLHPIVDYNTVEMMVGLMVGLVVCTNHLCYFSTR